MERTIGRYKIEETLGKGAMGKVYLAFDPVIERQVALKTIRLDRLDDDQERDEFIERFFQEARICGKLRHPGAVTVHDMGSHDDEPFIVMEYIRGEDLGERMREPMHITRDEVMTIIHSMAQTLDAAHDLGIVHRDIKPQNVMVTESGAVKILDFGIAKVAGSEMTVDGVFWGTPAYAAPEQLGERRTDKRADLYAFAVLVHRLITGKDVFQASSLKKLFYKIMHEPPVLARPLPHLAVPVRSLKPIMLKALHKDPEERYQRASEFSTDLLALFEETLGPEDDGDPMETTRTIPGLNLDETTRKMGHESPEDRVARMRAQFRQALADGNLLTCRHLLRSLNRKGVDTEEETETLAQAEAAEAEQKQSLAERLIHHKREAFQQQLQAGDLEAATMVLKSLESLDAPVTGETKALALHKRDRISKAREERKNLEDALASGRLGSAKVSLRKLQRLGADVRSAKEKVAALEESQLQQASERMQMIADARESFQGARQERRPDEADEALAQLKEMGAYAHREEQQLAELAAQWVMEHPEALTHIHSDLKQAMGDGDLDGAQDLVHRLTLYGGEENTQVKRWKKRLDSALEKQQRRTIRSLERAFEEAIEEGDHPHVREIQTQLSELGANSDVYLWLLKKAEGKEAGPRPGRFRRFALATAAVLLAVIGSYWLWTMG